MRKEALLELADKWDRESEEYAERPVNASAGEENAINHGINKTKVECARQLRALVDLLGW